MNPQVKEKWINALLSGEYQQGKEVLRSSDEGLDNLNPYVQFDDELTTLVDLNDSGSSFEEIAKVIQEQL